MMACEVSVSDGSGYRPCEGLVQAAPNALCAYERTAWPAGKRGTPKKIFL